MHQLFSYFMAIFFSTLNACASDGQPQYYVVHGSASLYAMKKGSGYQLYNNPEKKIISTRVYDSICGYYAYSGRDNHVVVVSLNGRFGLIDAINGKEVLRPADSPITVFTDGIYTPEPLVWNIGGKKETLTSVPVYVDARWGYGNDLNPVIYYYTWSLDTYEYGTPRFGYCDKEGREVIPPLHESAGSFINGVAIVVKSGKYGVMNTVGETVIPFEYDKIEYFFGEKYLKLVKTIDDYNSLNGIADRSGKIIIPCEYNKIESFSHKTPDNTNYVELLLIGKEIAENTLLYGLVDANGNEVFPVKYGYINDDSHGRYILYASEKRVGMADNDRNIIIPMVYENVFSTMDPDYIIVVRNNKCGMVTPHNKVLIAPNKFEAIDIRFVHGKTFFLGMAGGKWGRISRTGQVLLSLKYENIEPYQEKDDNTMVVLLNGQWMRVDSKGNMIERYESNPYEIPELRPPHL